MAEQMTHICQCVKFLIPEKCVQVGLSIFLAIEYKLCELYQSVAICELQDCNIEMAPKN